MIEIRDAVVACEAAYGPGMSAANINPIYLYGNLPMLTARSPIYR